MSWRWTLGGVAEEHGAVSYASRSSTCGGLISALSSRSYTQRCTTKHPRSVTMAAGTAGSTSSNGFSRTTPTSEEIDHAYKIIPAAARGGHLLSVSAPARERRRREELYPNMAPLRGVSPRRALADEISPRAQCRARLRSPGTAPRSAGKLRKAGYETAVKGKLERLCVVSLQRSRAQDFDAAEFWNPKIHTPQCCECGRGEICILPSYLKRTEWALSEGLQRVIWPSGQKLRAAAS